MRSVTPIICVFTAVALTSCLMIATAPTKMMRAIGVFLLLFVIALSGDIIGWWKLP